MQPESLSILSLEEAKALFRVGEFAELVRRFHPRQAAFVQPDPALQLLVAHAMVMVGNVEQAKRMSEVNIDEDSAVLRARTYLVRGLIEHASGGLTTAAQHFRTAVRFAQESKDPYEIAWASVYLLNHLVNVEPNEVVMALLPEVRKAVIRAADPHATAYLHQAITVLEGQTGGLDEARRHCELADSLLTLLPNVWLSTNSLLNRACIHMLTCRYAVAAREIEIAKKRCASSGLARGISVADSNLGHVQLQTGEFKRALRSFKRTMDSPFTSTFARLGALEGTARVHLALGQLTDCESTLGSLDSRVQGDSKLGSMYHVRWSAITRARLLLRSGNASLAITELLTTEQRIRGIGDKPLQAAIHLTLAQALYENRQYTECATRLLSAERIGITRQTEMQGQYYWTAAGLVGNTRASLARTLIERARNLWQHQGIESVPKEIPLREEGFAQSGNVPAPEDSAAVVLNALGSAIDLGHMPQVLGRELQRVLELIGCESTIDATDDRRRRPATVAIDLGLVEGKKLVLTCEPPSDVTKSLLMGDVLRIGQAAVSLEKVNVEERKRAALWPADPIETEAGALFLAEEMQTLLTTARRIAPTTVPVLLTGETGTGKEVLARLIHAYSNRAKAVFQPFNCSAVPKEMLDSQLFGHRRGSFTGAADNFAGVIRAAAGGTLFLDEIGETTLDVQPKLLRFLESSEVHPIGELHPARVDVRLIAATNADLNTLVSHGRFREDLFYRLNIVRLHIPPLRERRVEIPVLANHYLHKHAVEYGKGDLRLSEETMEFLVLYRWPGNVRQLANEMRRLAALAESSAVLMPEHLSPDIAASRRTIAASERTLEPTEVVVRLDQPMAAAVHHLERALILHALKQTGANMEETAALLGLSRKGLYLKRQRYEIELPGQPDDLAST
jgi:DNA-binding NtrC family response regulator